MPVKKRTAKGRAHRILPEHLDLWREQSRIRDAGTHEHFEPEGRRREYLTLGTELRRGLGLPPWSVEPIDAVEPQPPGYITHNSIQAKCWAKAWELRCTLEDAIQAEGNDP